MTSKSTEQNERYKHQFKLKFLAFGFVKTKKIPIWGYGLSAREKT